MRRDYLLTKPSGPYTTVSCRSNDVDGVALTLSQYRPGVIGHKRSWSNFRQKVEPLRKPRASRRQLGYPASRAL